MDPLPATKSPYAEPAPVFDAADEEVVGYRRLSSMALLGLLAGLVSPLALLGSMLWLVPLAAVGLSGLALWQIAAQAPHVIGRKAALTGLMLGVAMLVAAPTDYAVYRYLIRREVKEFAAKWIDAVRHRSIYEAHVLTIDPKHRPPPDANLLDFYRANDSYRTTLEIFRRGDAVRTLFALGSDAEYRYYETAAEGPQENGDVEGLTYAVTFNDPKKGRTTFFITFLMSRTTDRANGQPDWTMVRVEGKVRPSGW